MPRVRPWSVTVVENQEEWLWYALASAAPAMEAMAVADLGSKDRSRERAVAAAGGRLRLLDLPAGSSPVNALAAARELAARGGATHALLLPPAELHSRRELFWCRRLLEETALEGARLGLPPRQHERRHDPEPTDGVLIRHLALQPLRPGRDSLLAGEAGPEPVVRWVRLEGLGMDAAGRLLEPTGELVDHSPWRLRLTTTPVWDFGRLPSGPGAPFPAWAAPPQVRHDPAGPGHPRLRAGGLGS